MKDLISINNYDMLGDKDKIARVDSRYITKSFEKRHSHVIRNIESITQPKSWFSENFVKTNFYLTKYIDSTGKKSPCYLL